MVHGAYDDALSQDQAAEEARAGAAARVDDEGVVATGLEVEPAESFVDDLLVGHAPDCTVAEPPSPRGRPTPPLLGIGSGCQTVVLL